MFLAKILAILKKLKITEKKGWASHSCDQNYILLALSVFAVEERTEVPSEGKPISSFGLCEPVGD